MDKSVQWLYAAEQSSGGIAAWRNPDGSYHKAYEEVTGYLIPTMLKWGAGDLARRCADWLLTVQNKDGSFNGLDDVPRPFDTSAIIEGLVSMFQYTGEIKYTNAALAAQTWMRRQVMKEGYLPNSPRPNTLHAEIYNLRASAIILNKQELNYWHKRGLIKEHTRAHYLAYALEGALNFGDTEFARPYLEEIYQRYMRLIPFWLSRDWRNTDGGDDICATAQFAILFHRMGWDVRHYCDILKNYVMPNGGIWQSTTDKREIAWAIKFYLDLKEAVK